VELKRNRQLQVSIAGLPFPQAHLSTKDLSGKLRVCQAGGAIKQRNDLWVWTDRLATFSSAMDVLPGFDFLTQL
jgi:hypothetical protein